MAICFQCELKIEKDIKPSPISGCYWFTKGGFRMKVELWHAGIKNGTTLCRRCMANVIKG